MARAFITGIAGTAIAPAERDFLAASDPWGLILFKRNIREPAQVRDLVAEFRSVVARREAPVLIDQEGGRVQRLAPPHWAAYPAAAAYGDLYDRDPAAAIAAARLGARLIATDLVALGITVDCLPVADLPAPGADPVIGERAYGISAQKVVALATAAAEGLTAGGVLPVLKHLPGHGRARADSHQRLPVVRTDRATLEATDFAVFRALSALPLGMTAHVVFAAIDALPATTSATIITDVIRSFIGFTGLLMSDDIAMGALSGPIGARAAAALAAGCDVVLHCNGRLDEMRAVAASAPDLAGPAGRRAAAALATRGPPQPLDIAAARGEFSRLMAATTGVS